MVENALTQEDLAPARRALEAQHRPLPSKRQVLGSVRVILQEATD
jgi:hypothetical protein